jgi:hypothetical protein
VEVIEIEKKAYFLSAEVVSATFYSWKVQIITVHKIELKLKEHS